MWNCLSVPFHLFQGCGSGSGLIQVFRLNPDPIFKFGQMRILMWSEHQDLESLKLELFLTKDIIQYITYIDFYVETKSKRWTLCGQNQVGSVSGFFRGSDQDADPFLSRKPDQDQFHPDPQPFIQRLPFLSIMFHSLSRIRRINLVCACEANNKCPRKTENLICLN